MKKNTTSPAGTHAPWTLEFAKAYDGSDREKFLIRDERGFDFVRGMIDCPADAAKAAFIVRACNSHEELLEALKAHVEYGDERYDDEYEMIDRAARDAIVKAEGL